MRKKNKIVSKSVAAGVFVLKEVIIGENHEFDVHDLKPGLYFLKYNASNFIKFIKI